MATIETRCQKIVLRSDGSKRQDGSSRTWHEKCSQPGAEREFVGELTTVKDVLCDRHYKAALDEIERQRRGEFGKQTKKAFKPSHPDQMTL